MTILQAVNVTKISGGQRSVAAVKALDSFSLEVAAGEFVGIRARRAAGRAPCSSCWAPSTPRPRARFG